MIARAVAFYARHGETIAIATTVKILQAELGRRAEYAMKYGIHSPTQLRREILTWIFFLSLYSLFVCLFLSLVF
jgi:hypothetical protein